MPVLRHREENIVSESRLIYNLSLDQTMKILKSYIYTLFGLSLLMFTSCEHMMDMKSDSFVFDEDHKLNTANDSLYSAMGILSQLQTLGERYVLLGEIRGDLVSVPSNAPIDYQNLSNFEPLTGSDVFGMKRDYYNVINNCNVALQRMDTTITENSERVMISEYAAIKTFKAWTLLQVALAYGKVNYTDEPILDLTDTEIPGIEMDLDGLVAKLISELTPIAGVATPNYGSVDGLQSSNFFIRPALLLADLALYAGDYQTAAGLYYKVIDEGGYMLYSDYANHWTTSVKSEAIINHLYTYSWEVVSEIPYASDAKQYHPNLVNLTYNNPPSLLPASWFINEMNSMTHYHIDRVGINNITGYLEGDLRGMLTDRDGKTFYSSFGNISTGFSTQEAMITKFMANGYEYSTVTNPGNPLFDSENYPILTREVPLYRVPHLYLRYAEAANRAGCPGVAFGVLKYGLRNETLNDSTKINPQELIDNPVWTNFYDYKYDGNYGTAMRGRGLGIAVDATDYIIPELRTKNDSIEWVEERILEELAAETAFEGNRFFDLLRISRHRSNHPSYMAEKIARRFDNPAAIEAKLQDINNLWLK